MLDKLFIFVIALIFSLSSCMQLPTKQYVFPTQTQLSGEAFSPFIVKQNSIEFNVDGSLLLSPGDYVIPVWTFCLQSNLSSPSGYRYNLGKLQGSRAKIIRQIMSKALHRFSTDQIQMLVWHLHAGLSYSEMTKSSQTIIDEVASEFKSELKQAVKFEDIIKLMGVVSDSAADSISELKKMRDRLMQVGDNYEELRRSIVTRPLSTASEETAWSKISDNVYARFKTEGHFQQLGFVEIRVIGLNRQTSSEESNNAKVDISSLVAYPNNSKVQPLSLSMAYGAGGAAANVPMIYANPYAMAAMLIAMLGAKAINWDAFFDTSAKIEKSANQAIKDLMKHGSAMLNEVHDRLDKPLKENKIVSGRDLDKNSPGTNRDTRQYEKKGDSKTLAEDFEKLPGKKTIAQDGTEIKILPNGDKAVKRPKTEKNEIPTLEIQSPDGAKEKIKVRYVL